MPVYVFAENTVSNDPNVFFDSEFYHEVTRTYLKIPDCCRSAINKE